MRQRDIINKHLDEELKYEIAKAKITWEGKQFIVRFPSNISELIKLNKKNPQWVEFKLDHDTGQLEIKLLPRGTK